MQVIHRDDVTTPFVTDHGEVVYELIGRAAEVSTERHSLAYVVIPPGKSSLGHLHPQAEESYYILKGQARMALGEEEAIVGPGQAILISPSCEHKITNVGQENLELLAICVPAWEPTNSVWLE